MRSLSFGSRRLDLARSRVMGILNVTPDSFSDGGSFLAFEAALKQARLMKAEGADIIDVGGESTRPGAEPVSEADEIERVVPLIRALSGETQIPVSIDTSKPGVMRAAVEAGASMINDVNALRAPGALEVAADSAVAVCLMHMQGEPRTMQQAPRYGNVVEDVYAFLNRRVEAAISAGISEDRLVLDPGFGFGKALAHNLALLAHLDRFTAMGLPLLAGISRKSMIGALLGERPTGDRLYGSLAAAVLAAERGADILRVHDVAPTVDALAIVAGVREVEEIGS